MKTIHFCSEKKINKTISEMFVGFKIHTISAEEIKIKNFITGIRQKQKVIMEKE